MRILVDDALGASNVRILTFVPVAPGTGHRAAGLAFPGSNADARLPGVPRWIVDASNVMGSRPDGWWRDRDGALRRLVDEVVRWRAATGDPVLIVADGSPSASVPEGTIGGVHVRFAHSSARDAADDEIERIVSGHEDPASLTAVTSDRALRSRIERHGASVVGAGRFLEILADTPKGGRSGPS